MTDSIQPLLYIQHARGHAKINRNDLAFRFKP